AAAASWSSWRYCATACGPRTARWCHGSVRPGAHCRSRPAYARWGWSDLVYALAPNGRLMDAVAAPRDQSRDPLGIGKQPIVDTLYLGGAGAGFLAPPGADPTADLGEQHDLLDAGEPPSAALVAGSRQTYT